MPGFKSSFFKYLNKFSTKDREIFDRIYKVWETKGKLVPPKEMIPWIQSTFGDVEQVKEQTFVKITNIVTYEGAVFNELRTMRPIVEDVNFTEVHEQIESIQGGPFSNPETGTPADVFGRVKGQHSITAANVAKYDGMHGLIIFNDYNPLIFSRKKVRDYFDVAEKWFKRAHNTTPKAIYPLFTWNCLWRAAASVIHGHAQVALTEGQAYAKIEELRFLTHKYQETFRQNYFDDVYYVHEKLGLGFERGGVKLMSKITPVKEKEVLIISHQVDNNLADVVSDTLNAMKEKLAVASFNLSMILHPMEKTPEVWDHMPIVVRIVDRGQLSRKTADIGAMEIYAQSVIGSNPYTVIKELKRALL